MSKAKAAAKGKKRAQRATSNVFAMFDQAQIQEFKEAFNMIDQNHDGFIDKDDLHDMLASLGKLGLLAVLWRIYMLASLGQLWRYQAFSLSSTYWGDLSRAASHDLTWR